jgi:hypothetical protein
MNRDEDSAGEGAGASGTGVLSGGNAVSGDTGQLAEVEGSGVGLGAILRRLLMLKGRIGPVMLCFYDIACA